MMGIRSWWTGIRSLWFLFIIRRNPIYRVATDELRAIANDENFTSYMPQTMREQFAANVMGAVRAIALAPNPVMANREALCERMMLCAHYGVLILPAAPERDTTGFRGQLGITGQLRSRLKDALRKSETFRDRLGDAGHDVEEISDDQAYSSCYFAYLESHSIMRVLDKVRHEYNDHIAQPGRDWQNPMLSGLYAWEEDCHRTNLDLPKAEGMDVLLAVGASTMVNITREGANNPLYEWEKHYEKKFPWRDVGEPSALTLSRLPASGRIGSDITSP